MEMETKKNESAFPLGDMAHRAMIDGHYRGLNEYSLPIGLTKREYFAAMAMQGYLSAYSDSHYGDITRWSVELSDMLIAELNKKP